MKRPEYKLRKKSVYFKCMCCEEGIHSVDNTDWITDDGYNGVCADCMIHQDDKIKSYAADIKGKS